MARIVVLQHNPHAHAGRLGRTLRDHGFRLDVRRPDIDPEQIPSDIDDLHGLVILGGHQNVDEGHAFLPREQALIRAMHAAERPVVGICLGSQQITKALGGSVDRMPEPEVGITPIRLSVAGQTDTILAGVPWSCPMLHSHAYHAVTPAPGASVLASSDKCKVQAYRIGLRTYGFQFHFECDIPMVSEMFDRSRELADRAGLSRAQLDAQLERHAEMFDRAADRICKNLAVYTFTFHELLSV